MSMNLSLRIWIDVLRLVNIIGPCPFTSRILFSVPSGCQQERSDKILPLLAFAVYGHCKYTNSWCNIRKIDANHLLFWLFILIHHGSNFPVFCPFSQFSCFFHFWLSAPSPPLRAFQSKQLFLEESYEGSMSLFILKAIFHSNAETTDYT